MNEKDTDGSQKIDIRKRKRAYHNSPTRLEKYVEQRSSNSYSDIIDQSHVTLDQLGISSRKMYCGQRLTGNINHHSCKHKYLYIPSQSNRASFSCTNNIKK